jgi:YrbI family 3-deoxy-D-manno-octulosonate 8-phosphate phosphatase
MNIANRAKAIQLVLSDVDGVLTDGGIVFDNQGIEIKRFHIRDGMGIRLWQRAGHRFGLLTSRTSHVVQVRAAELGIDLVRQGFEEKLPVVIALMRELNLTPQQVCYIGDDLPDLPVLKHVGLGVAVADAAAELLAAAHHTTTARGGQGAVRELIEMLLKAQGRYDDLIAKYSGS